MSVASIASGWERDTERHRERAREGHRPVHKRNEFASNISARLNIQYWITQVSACVLCVQHIVRKRILFSCTFLILLRMNTISHRVATKLHFGIQLIQSNHEGKTRERKRQAEREKRNELRRNTLSAQISCTIQIIRYI